jgi:hypothetical protein
MIDDSHATRYDFSQQERRVSTTVCEFLRLYICPRHDDSSSVRRVSATIVSPASYLNKTCDSLQDEFYNSFYISLAIDFEQDMILLQQEGFLLQ